jgi:outer membrane biosynthesis protein TonB
MKNHPLFNPLLYSVGLHSFFLIAAILYIFIAGAHYKAPVFMVSLVDLKDKGSSAATEKPDETEEIKEITVTPPPETPTKKMSKAEERIAALEAKKQIESLRKKKAVSISKSDIKLAAEGSQTGGTYESLIMTKIKKNWATSDFLNKYRNLLTIINIRIARNGNVTILGFEKKSGNPLYDREAVRAISASTPLPPPASEIEYSLRFHPNE